MKGFLEPPDPSRGELKFSLFTIPVRVHPYFWLISLFMAYNREIGQALIWVAVVFFSILIHELGQALMMLYFRDRPEIILYSWGGLSIPGRKIRRSPTNQILISLAGPFFGFLLAGAVVLAVPYLGGHVEWSTRFLVMPSIQAYFSLDPSAQPGPAYLYKTTLVNDLLWLNIFWGIVNLLPIFPLDGGQATRELLGPDRQRLSLRLSLWTAVAMALLGLMQANMYSVIFFGTLGAGSAQALEAYRPFKPRPYPIR